jgi:hypothetical protein
MGPRTEMDWVAEFLLGLRRPDTPLAQELIGSIERSHFVALR